MSLSKDGVNEVYVYFLYSSVCEKGMNISPQYLGNLVQPVYQKD